MQDPDPVGFAVKNPDPTIARKSDLSFIHKSRQVKLTRLKKQYDRIATYLLPYRENLKPTPRDEQ
uniref:Uncharacterized protein n=1 Tax=Romanomermis culicivorax TaxID=13658 RepID=A0A915IP40_ROMCU